MPYRIKVNGVVQGVGFRPFVYRLAHLHSLKGYVKNLSSSVEIAVSGEDREIKAFVEDLKEKAPPLSRIDEISIESLDEDGFSQFKIEKSGDKGGGRLVIPPDIALCSECLDELFDGKDRRYLYPFINCTNCGQRFSLIGSTPYDREKTSMREFRMCNVCLGEYQDPLDRRYHAQTTSCPICGPSYFLRSADGRILSYNHDAIELAAELLDKGEIIGIKGFGGFHIASKTEDEEVLMLRDLLGRRSQPFAIMAKSVDEIRRFAHLSEEEEAYITSFTRPILILKKKDPFPLSEHLAPGLDTIGVMLPYSPLHHILFSFSRCSSFVMTSANLPDDPMVIENQDAIDRLGFLNYLLMSDLEIINRIDDSVIKFVSGNPLFIRRSRGYVPLDLPLNGDRVTLSLGAELSNTFTITKNGRAVISQHIGNTHNYDALLFMREAIERMMTLLGVERFEMVYCDLHPAYNTTVLAPSFGTRIYQLQHHFAHALSLLGDRGARSGVVISCDGMGYGADGRIWGGEVLYIDLDEGEFERVGHLEYQRMVGGDLSAYFPLRMAFSILRRFYGSHDFFMEYAGKFRYGKKELEVIEKEWERCEIMTSSCGRVLDALASLLGISYERTYEGEPAMRLEAAADGDLIEMEVETAKERGIKRFIPWVEYGSEIEGEEGDLQVVRTSLLLHDAFELWKRGAKRGDLVRSFIHHLTSSLCDIAIDACSKFDVESLGFSGGCAYNRIMTRVIKERARENNLNLLLHKNVPAGDGGISFGQAQLSQVIE